MGAGGDEELVIALAGAVVKDDFLGRPVEADCLDALFPVDPVEGLEVFFDEAETLDGALSGQVFVKDAAGIDIFIFGDQHDLTVFIEPAQLPDRVDAGRGGADDDILFTHTTSPPRA